MYFTLTKVWGTTPGFVTLVKKYPPELNIYVFLIMGTIIGSLISALISGEFKIRIPKPRIGAMAFLGGTLMGIGLALAPGCNIGNMISGLAALATAAFIGTAAMVAGIYLVIKLIR
jgi:hypothetical protein